MDIDFNEPPNRGRRKKGVERFLERQPLMSSYRIENATPGARIWIHKKFDV